MKDDDILKGLKNTIKEQRSMDALWDEQWDALAAGTLSPDEEAKLKELANSSSEAAKAYEAFRPLGQDFKKQLLKSLPNLQSAPLADSVVVNKRTRSAQPSKKKPWSAWRSWFVWAPVAVAAAAAIALLVVPTLNMPPLPSYSIQMNRGVQQMRGAPSNKPLAEPPRFSVGSRLEIALRPKQSVSGELKVVSFLERRDGLREIDLPTELAKEGAVRIRGVVGKDIRLPSGDCTLWIVVGRAGALPSIDELKQKLQQLNQPAAGKQTSSKWTALKARLHID